MVAYSGFASGDYSPVLLPEDPSVNQQIVSQLTVAQPVFGFFMVVVFAPLTEELIFRGMLARYLFPKAEQRQTDSSVSPRIECAFCLDSFSRDFATVFSLCQSGIEFGSQLM